MLSRLGHSGDGNALPLEIPDRVGTVGVSQGTGMSESPVTEVVQRHSFREARINPFSCLVDDAEVPLTWVSVTDDKIQAGMATEQPEHHSENPGLADRQADE